MTRKLLVTVDSLREDHFEYMPATRAFLDREHDRAYATFPETFGSFPAIVGGRYAVERGLPRGASVANEVGGRRIGITTNHLLSPGYNYDEGFDAFDSPAAGGEGIAARFSDLVEIGGPAYRIAATGWNAIQRGLSLVRQPGRTFREAEDVVASFLHQIDGVDEWFGWLHFMEVHHPYEPDGGPVRRIDAQNVSRRAIAGRLDPADAPTVRDLYRREVEELDIELRRLWEALPADAEVVFTADHGELLGFDREDGVWGHPGVLHPNLLGVPFGTRNVDADLGPVVSLIDVPTILRGTEHGEGTLDRSYAFGLYGDARAVTDGEQFVAYDPDDDPDPYRAWSIPDGSGADPDDDLVAAIEEFSVEGGLTRYDADEETLQALGYLE